MSECIYTIAEFFRNEKVETVPATLEEKRKVIDIYYKGYVIFFEDQPEIFRRVVNV